MFNMAVKKLELYQPDLIIVAFITDDITRRRFWRTTITKWGKTRCYNTIKPVAFPKAEEFVDMAFIEPKITPSWYKSAKSSLINDPVLIEINKSFKDILYRKMPIIQSLKTSFLFDRIVYKDPFYRTLYTIPERNPRIDFDNYMMDEEFEQNIKLLIKKKFRL